MKKVVVQLKAKYLKEHIGHIADLSEDNDVLSAFVYENGDITILFKNNTMHLGKGTLANIEVFPIILSNFMVHYSQLFALED